MSLRLTGDVHIAPTADELYDDLAHDLLDDALHAVGDRGAFHLALSGGSTPQPFYMRLVTDPRYRLIPWQQTHLWLVDERRVPADDQRSNFRMIRELLIDHVPVDRRSVHPIPALDDDPAAAYENELRRFLPRPDQDADPPRLDFVLLGMGHDAHTASLFPNSPAQAEKHRWVAVNQGPTVAPPQRVTMTYPLLNAAGRLALLVTGKSKAETVRRIHRQLNHGPGPDPAQMPVTGLEPASAAAGRLTWYLDAAAASSTTAGLTDT